MSLQINQVSKTYKNGVKAIDNLNLEIGTGMFGLLGPNGAGKSTLMRTIATLQEPDTGTIFFHGKNIFKDKNCLRQVLGYLPQEFGVYPNESADSLLNYFAILKGISSKKDRKIMIDKVLELTNLLDARKKNVKGYSGGMKQRFGIAQLLLNNPKLIIVDEPTAGLDPAERIRFLNILREISIKNTVIFSTHIVADVKDLCNEMGIINNGKLIEKVIPKDSITEINDQIWKAVISLNDFELYNEKYKILSSHHNNDNSLSLRIHSKYSPNTGFTIATPTIEDVYFIALNK